MCLWIANAYPHGLIPRCFNTNTKETVRQGSNKAKDTPASRSTTYAQAVSVFP